MSWISRRPFFDRVSHRILVSKFAALTENLINSFNSYSEGADFKLDLRIFIHGKLSKSFPSASGIPQGSHFDPILFTLYVKDLVAGLRFEYLLFADDTKLLLQILSPEDAALLQEDANVVDLRCIVTPIDCLSSAQEVLLHGLSPRYQGYCMTSPTTFHYAIGGVPSV